jgi:predicted transposase YbfD/YdcC
MNKSTARELTKAMVIHSLQMSFEPVLDPRKRKGTYDASSLIVMATVAFMSGCQDWVHVADFCKDRHDICEILGLPQTPCHDTFNDFFNVLDHEQFTKCYTSWIYTIVNSLSGQVVSFDGKALLPTKWEKGKCQCHLVTAYIADMNISLSQVMTGEKSNEITAVSQLLDILSLEGAIITMDAMGCQRDTVKKITDKGADYCIALKGNQGDTHKSAEFFFTDLEQNKPVALDELHRVKTFKTEEKGHGRIETRVSTSVPAHLALGEETTRWFGVKSVTMIESTRYMIAKQTESTERRYYISSLEADSERLAIVIRKHWRVENNLHWHLDVTFGEDAKRIGSKNAAANMSLVRKTVMTILVAYNGDNMSLSRRMAHCSRCPEYAFEVIKNLV